MTLPVEGYTEEGFRSPHWLKWGGTAHTLYKLVPVAVLTTQEGGKLSPALAEETERIKLRTNTQRATLARKMDGLEVQIYKLKAERDAVTSYRGSNG